MSDLSTPKSKKTLQKKERITYFVIALFGLLFVIGGLSYGLVTPDGAFGAGLFPVLIGSLVFLTAVILGFSTKGDQKNELDPIPRDNKIKAVLTIAAVIIYCLILNLVGFLVTSFLLMLAVQIIMGSKKIINQLLIAAVVTIITWFIFYKWLGIELPSGILQI